MDCKFNASSLFQPKMTGVPEGNWYCFECISKATGEAVCVRCGKKANKLVICDLCPRAMHMDCMEPPLCRMPRRWACWMCQKKLVGFKGPFYVLLCAFCAHIYNSIVSVRRCKLFRK